MTPKIIKMERNYCGIINYTDQLLNSGYSFRVIAKKLREKFACNISHESVRQYRLFKDGKYTNEIVPVELYYYVKRIRSN